MIRAIAIDLDDTLLDTTGLLLQAAAVRACTAMKDQGLSCSMEECLRLREEFAADYSHKEIFFKIAELSDPTIAQTLGEIGRQTFYRSPIPSLLPLMKNAEEVLTSLQPRYSLYLVTSGATTTQQEKVNSTGVAKYFKKVFIVDKMKDENKTQAFQEILRLEKIEPAELLSVGNRLAEEIRLAKKLGATTCYFEYGEHIAQQKMVPEDVPDFTVQSWKEFLSECRL